MRNYEIRCNVQGKNPLISKQILLTNSNDQDQSGEFMCGYWDLKG